MTSDPRRWLSVALSIPGVVAFFLPFAFGTSPFEVLPTLDWREFGSWSFFGLGGLLAGIALPIAAMQIRLVVSERLSRFEISVSVLLGLLASPLLLGAFMLPLFTSWEEWQKAPTGQELVEMLVAVGPAAILTIVLPVLAVRLRRQLVHDADISQSFLVLSYFPNAVFFLTLFGVNSEPFYEDWDIGAYVGLLACVCYLTMALLVVFRRPAPKVMSEY